jgi:hypothetical protein
MLRLARRPICGAAAQGCDTGSRYDSEAGPTRKPGRLGSRYDSEAGTTRKPVRLGSRYDSEAGPTRKPGRLGSRYDSEADTTRKPSRLGSRADSEAGPTRKPGLLGFCRASLATHQSSLHDPSPSHAAAGRPGPGRLPGAGGWFKFSTVQCTGHCTPVCRRASVSESPQSRHSS